MIVLTTDLEKVVYNQLLIFLIFDILIFDFIKEGCPSTELVYKGPST